jgi:glycosyltransferase involved in cell wall biosynthesis
MKLSLIIPCHGDSQFLEKTLDSILAHGPSHDFEIIVIDDGNSPPLTPLLFKTKIPIRWFHHQIKLGCAPARMTGARNARGEFLLLTDSHMVFPPDWFTLWTNYRQTYNELFCTSYAGLTIGGNPVSLNSGASFHFFKTYPQLSLMDIAPLPFCQESRQPVASIIGAGYFISKQLFNKLHGLTGLAFWGGDEQLLSLKAWLAGYDIFALRDLTLGHINTQPLYGPLQRTHPAWLLYNKLVVAFIILTPEHYRAFTTLCPRSTLPVALNYIRQNCSLLQGEREYFCQNQQLPLQEFCDRFEIESLEEIAAREMAL